MDGRGQAVGSGPGPGTLSPPVNVFCFFLPFTPCNHVSPKDGSPVCFCQVSICFCVCRCVCVCVVLNSVSQKNCVDH